VPTLIQNFYKTTITRNWTATTGDFNVSTKPTISAGWLVISANNTTLREIIKYTATGTNAYGDFVTVSERGIGGTTAQTHSIGESVRMNITAEHWAELNANAVAPTLEVGTVTELDPGTTPTVVNSGTTVNAIFDFALPLGAQIYSTILIPDNSVGNNGDWAFSTSSTSNVWYKSAGVWGLVNSNKGVQGDTGVGITSITLTGTLGLVDTYTITYDDATTSTFNITNGAQGIQGLPGNDGADGIMASVVAGTKISVDNTDPANPIVNLALGLDDNFVTDAQVAALHGVNDANTTSNSYADGKVADTITDGVTTVAPSQNAVFDSLALKAPLASPTFTGLVTTPALKITTGAGAGKVATSDADGDVTWETPSGGASSALTLIPKSNISDIDVVGAMVFNSNTKMHIGQIVVPFNIVVNKISIYGYSVTTAGTITITMYSEDGQTQLFSVTSSTFSSQRLETITVGAVSISAGVYYIAVNSNGTAALQTFSWGQTTPFTAGYFNNEVASEPIMEGTLTITADTPPLTITPTSITAEQKHTLICRIDN